MTDKARELLERALFALESAAYFDRQPLNGKPLAEEIRAYLAEPEPKRKTLNDGEMGKGFIWYGPRHEMNQYEIFKLGARFAEKHHGIGGEE